MAENMDIKTVENDSIATVLMDLIGLIAERAFLPLDKAMPLMDRIVKLEAKTLSIKAKIEEGT